MIASFPRNTLNPHLQKIVCSLALICGDALSLVAVGFVPLLIKPSPPTNIDALIFILISILFILTSLFTGQYWKRMPFWDQNRELLKVFCFLITTQTAAAIIMPESGFSKVYLASWISVFFVIISIRSTIKEALMRLNLWQLPTIIVGIGENAKETALALLDEKHLGYQVALFVSVSQNHDTHIIIKDREVPIQSIDYISTNSLYSLGNPQVIVALETGEMPEQQNYINQLTLHYPTLFIAPPLRGLPLFRAKPHHFFSHEVMMLEINNHLCNFSAQTLKRLFDIVVALLAITCLSPLLLCVVILIRRTGSEVVYAHERVGLNGKPFQCLKFRSMVKNSQDILEDLLLKDKQALQEWNNDRKLKNDPRITRFGQFIRKTSIDELPQLWNVLKGEMSIVGPRPVVQEELGYYGQFVNFYYKSRPGITGLWQVSGRNDLDYERRVELDVWYISNWSIWNDFVILMRTFKVVLSNDGAY